MILQEKQKKLQSIEAQRNAIERKGNELGKDVGKMEVTVNGKQQSLSDAIMTLQNHPFYGKTQPDSEDEKYYIRDTEMVDMEDGTQVEGVVITFKQTEYNADLQAWEECQTLESTIKDQEKELGLAEGELEQLMKASEAAEQELIKKDASYDVTIGEIEELNEELEQAQFELEAQSSKGLTADMDAQLDRMVELGFIKDKDEAQNLSKEQLNALCNKLVEFDNANTGSNYKDGMDAHYTKMKAGDTQTYSLEQFKDMADAAGYELDESLFDTESGFGISAKDLSELNAAQKEKPPVTTEPETPEEAPTEPKKPIVTDDGIMLPRLNIRVGNSETGKQATELADYGITRQEDGTYKSSTGQTFTKDEVNDYFRELEETATGIDQKWFNKAHELGIEITDGMTNKEVKHAVKEQEKINELTPKAEQYGVEISEDMTSDDIDEAIDTAKDDAKALIKQAKKAGVDVRGFSVEDVAKDPTKLQEAITAATTPPTPVVETPTVETDNNEAETDAPKNTRQMNGLYARDCTNINLSNDLHSTISYNEDGTVSQATTNLSDVEHVGSLSLEWELRSLVKRKSTRDSSHEFNFRNDRGETLLSSKGGVFYDSKGREIDDNKAYNILEKAIRKGQLNDLVEKYL